jgi:uncharacterized membrane protein SpoIIM required for sporulation
MSFREHHTDMRKLAAIDILFLGRTVTIAEYACGVILSGALGLFALFRSHSSWQYALSTYLLFLGINYIPMLLYACAIGSRESANVELADELVDKRRAMSKYRRQSLFLLVPLLLPILSLWQRSESREVIPK